MLVSYSLNPLSQRFQCYSSQVGFSWKQFDPHGHTFRCNWWNPCGGQSSCRNLGHFPPCFSYAISRTISHVEEEINERRSTYPSSWATALCNSLEKIVDKTDSSPLCYDPTLALHSTGNYHPVQKETPSTRYLESSGTIPSCLEGLYVRNGPNPQYMPSNPERNHFFDGDGMLHAVRIKNGHATYTCRYVGTSRYIQEKTAGQKLFLRFFGDLRGPLGLARFCLLLLRAGLGLADLRHGMGVGNTSIIFHNGSLLALSDDDCPYVVKVTDDGDLETIGRADRIMGEKLPWSVCSHPKLDPQTGEMLAFGCNPLLPPYLVYFRVTSDGRKSPYIPITLPQPSLTHDFAVTQNYVAFPDTPLVCHLHLLLHGRSPIVYDSRKILRLGVLARDAKDDSSIRWFELPGFHFFHIVNAWEEGDTMVLVSPVMHGLESKSGNILTVEYISLCEIRLSLATGKVSWRVLANENLELGSINPMFSGRKTRYCYMGVGSLPLLTSLCRLSEIVKVDLWDSRVTARRTFGERRYASEPIFVPADRGSPVEDEGFVLCFVHDEDTATSEFHIMDAQSPSLKTLASIKLPSRVPYGTHGLFIAEDELKQQRHMVVQR